VRSRKTWYIANVQTRVRTLFNNCGKGSHLPVAIRAAGGLIVKFLAFIILPLSLSVVLMFYGVLLTRRASSK